MKWADLFVLQSRRVPEAHEMFDALRAQIEQSRPFELLLESLAHCAQGSDVSFGGVTGSLMSFVVSSLTVSLNKQVLLVTADRPQAEQLSDDLSLLHGDSCRLFSTPRGHSVLAESGPLNSESVATLRALKDSAADLIVTPADSLPIALPDPESFSLKMIRLEQGKDEPLAQLVQRLDAAGFVRQDFVGAPGEYSLRGGILDVFSHASEYPVRCEFFGDTVESMRDFDPLSQRSIREISAASIVPNVLGVGGGQGDPPRKSTLLHYLKPDAILVLMEPELIWEQVEEVFTAGDDRTLAPAVLKDQFSRLTRLNHESMSHKRDRIDFASSSQPSFNGNIRLLREHLLKLRQSQFHVVIACDGQTELKRLRELLTEPMGTGDDTSASQPAREVPADLTNVELIHHAVHAGFALPEERFACYTEHQIFGRQKRKGKRREARFRGFSDKELKQLRRGDFVVHEDFGIGRFDGLKRIRVRSIEQEVMKLLYEEGDTLYVNLNYLGRVQKYSSKDGHTPKLTRLGTQEWERLKERAKKRIQDIARDLIRLYASRKSSAGHSFPADTTWQKELEASFIYEDTFDQAKATLEVKQDMEHPFPMDRLVCGDVGFGKTEVAVRAAFKSVLDGKQVAVLVPTTILAIQHFNTFVDRTSRYAVRVAVLSRLKSRREQLQVLEQLAAGAIDIVIGTHRLLSRDVRFKDLGLLIIDEEHRFGVAAKEKLRQLRTTVDTLTLTATPIPRTLHFSLMGARDLSIIATPPRNRLPIITEVTQYYEHLITQAVRHELERGGQVYFVHDRVSDIGTWTGKLRAILPSARIRHAHGQMHARELEEVMLEFQEKKIDVLVCTKIIESGLDIPNVNTIIVNRADRFGMSELYQLRGRVGRSNIQAYAYLVVPPVSVLPGTTIQRLRAVEEFTELGSGFNLAMRDLEIRGAGDLLGAEQSGFIETMGFETYTRILDEAVRELKQQEFRGLFPSERPEAADSGETVVEVDYEALIPSSYIEDDSERLEMYRRMYVLTTHEQLLELGEELKDRFGPHPVELRHLLDAVRVRLMAGALGFKKVAVGKMSVDVEFPPDTQKTFYEGKDFQILMNEISSWKDTPLSLVQTEKALRLTARFPGKEDLIVAAAGFFERLADRIKNVRPLAVKV